MTENRRPMTTPDLIWLERAILAYGKGFLPAPVAHRFAEHILGNWLQIEDAQVRELVEAVKDADGWSLNLHSHDPDDFCEIDCPAQRLLAALAPFEKKGAP